MVETMARKYELEINVLSDKGKRKEANEDSVFANAISTEKGNYGLFAVADGVGGTELGKYASNLATERLTKWWNEHFPRYIDKQNILDEVTRELKLEVELMNIKIIEACNSFGKSMATTLSLMFVVNDEASIIHIGDSRVYKINKSQIEMLTEDHSWVELQVKSGAMTREDAEKHKNRHAIIRCLGAKTECKLYLNRCSVKRNDCFLLCTDGFYRYFADAELSEKLLSSDVDYESQTEMLESMLEEIYEKGASDNISAILVKINSKERKLAWWKN